MHLETIQPMILSNKYILPVPAASLERIDRSSSPAHTGKLRNAIDLIAPVGTPVFAAADGVVRFVKDESNTGGPSIEYWNDTNFIVIEHPGGEYSRYDHLEFKSAQVKPNQPVKSGQSIGRVGMTGFTYLPHLHFQVFVFTGPNLLMDFDTLPVQDFA
jgi:murein DD-endopeptidase MepM/ murein hydrolase activator NlpD